MLPSYFDYIFVHLTQKARLRPELSPKFLSTLYPKSLSDLQLCICVSSPQKFLYLPKHTTLVPGLLLLSYLQCTNYAVICDQIANKSFWGNTAKNFGEISQKTVLAIFKFTAICRTVIIAFSLKRYCSKSV